MSSYIFEAIVEIVAGVLILAVPRLLNYFVAICLITVGVTHLLR